MDSIKKIVSKTVNQIIALWVVFFAIMFGFLVVYDKISTTNQFINDQILTFSEINTEVTSVLYFNSQQNIAGEIDYSKTLLSQWMNTQRLSFSEIIPKSLPEINYLNELGQLFYSPENLNDNSVQIQNYQNLSDQLDLLKRLSIRFTQESPLIKLMPIFPYVCIGLLFIFIVLTLLMSNALHKTLMSKNEFILEDIWNELQGIEIETSTLIHETSIPNPDNHKINSLIKDSKDLLHSIVETKEKLIHYTPSGSAPNNTQLTEKIVFIQKLLSRLFTRAERAATLAKVASDNGFQAGILALNISIEAAKSGEAGKSFIPISDRVKDFSEKSDQIGKAIIDELRDVDVSVRKAYAMGKAIIEDISTNPETASDTELQELIFSFDNLFKISQQIQSSSSELQTTIELPTNNKTSDTSNFLKEILIKTFDRLYRFSYGTDPKNSHHRIDR